MPCDFITVTVRTADDWMAGTDGTLHLRLHSGGRVTPPLLLAGPWEHLARGRTARYCLPAPDGFGVPDAVTLEIADGEDWLFDRVEVAGRGWEPRGISGAPRGQWLSRTGAPTAANRHRIIHRGSATFPLHRAGEKPAPLPYHVLKNRGGVRTYGKTLASPGYRPAPGPAGGRTVRLYTQGGAHRDVPLWGRLIEIGGGAAHPSTLVEGDESAGAWPALTGVSDIAAFVPVPDRRHADGAGEYWLLHYDGRQDAVYRKLTVPDADDRAATVVAVDRPVAEWPSLAGIGWIDEVLAVPDRERVDGTSHYWVFHCGKDGPRCRKITIADGSPHVNDVEAGDYPMADWPCLAGVDRIDLVLPVHDRQHVGGGTNEYWVFHRAADGMRYRKIAIEDGTAHINTLLQADRPLADWPSLKGIE
ncbi:hypothetical protein FHS39_000216 [Streptomyces olivoverticillatus]|uniref:Uncharacterized protein n=1 Tax=Streptomyces olivoverticillatus TaxID=66427 RepID=A0A7W7PHM2_9ACTN|nr:hypothetical protein [Streptomyces olivoverticillatus]MBB4891216.1 hypothetical protein [Streptomyces olivoverticillatus]